MVISENLGRSAIPIFKPKLPVWSELKTYLEKIDENGWYSNYGPLSTSVESRIADYCGMQSSQIVTVANATLALEGALSTHLESGIWDCPAWTFAATPSALSRSSKEFRFVDIDGEWRIAAPAKETLNKFVVDVLPFGAAVNINRFESHVETILVDAAASFDSLRDLNLSTGKQIGIVLSFHATKSLPGGEGAVFISNDVNWVNRVRQWGNFGFSEKRSSEFVGTNSKMNEYSAAVVLASLDKWEKDKLVWEELSTWATRLTSSLGFKVQPSLSEGYVSPYWILQATPQIIERIESSFQDAMIQTRRWWGYGCHKMNAFTSIKKTDLQFTDATALSTLGLPFFKSLTLEERDRIESALLQVGSQN